MPIDLPSKSHPRALLNVRIDVLQLSREVFRFLCQRLYDQVSRLQRTRLHQPLRAKVHAQQRTDWTAVCGTTSTNDESTSTWNISLR